MKPGSGGGQPLDLLALGLFLATAATMAASWSRPGLAAVLVLVVTAPWHARGYQGSLISILTLICYYRLGTTATVRQQIGIGALALSVTAAGTIAAGSEAPGTVWQSGGWLVAAILLGRVVRSRRDLLAEFEERAIQAEADREAEAHQRVTEERLRIARDLHDVLAHTVSLMTVQAGVVADALERRPDRCRDAARALRAADRDATERIESLGGTLHQGPCQDGGFAVRAWIPLERATS